VVAETSPLLVPAAAVPVPPQIWRLQGNDHEMSHTGLDRADASRACICLVRLVRLDRVHHLVVESGEVRGEALRCREMV